MSLQEMADGLSDLGVVDQLPDLVSDVLAESHDPSVPGASRLLRNTQLRVMRTLNSKRHPLRVIFGGGGLRGDEGSTVGDPLRIRIFGRALVSTNAFPIRLVNAVCARFLPFTIFSG